MRPPLDATTRRHLQESYPRNHHYRVVGGRVWPSWRLWRRDRRLRRLIPEGSTSLLDLACSKGWFVLQARRRHGMERVLGIDVHEPDLRASRAVVDHVLGEAGGAVRLEPLRLAQVAASIEAWGGPFDVVLCVNLYHYLVLGSRRLPEVSGTHEQVFEQLARVCRGTLVFSNCVTRDQLPRHLRERAEELGLAGSYDEATIRAAAAPWFEVREHGRLGKRPLWTLVRRPGTSPSHGSANGR